MFSTRLTGIPSSRSAVESGMAELPTLTPSAQLPSQAAPIWPRSMPASASASAKASFSSCSEPASQRSPKREQPMPMIATLSLIPAIACSNTQPSGDRRRLPEITIEMAALVALLDAEHHLQPGADIDAAGGDIDELHQHPRADIEQ